MFLRAVIAGILATVLMVSVIASARLFDIEVKEETIILNDVSVIEMEPPPTPPELTEPETEPEEPNLTDTPPSPPALDVPLHVLSPNAPTLPLALETVSLNTPLQQFHTEIGVSKIPIKQVTPKKVYSKPSTPKKTKPKPTSQKPAPKPVTVIKSIYNSSELDRTPSVRKTGRFSWPSRARGNSGTVKLKIEINTSGRVKVLSVISSTDSALTLAAKKVAGATLFTVPTYRGKPVKCVYYKTFNLKKP